ncbi:MAG: gliding motility-associated C-terminal domain-containing protein, partial [Sphingobacteriales bacterium]
STVTKPGTYWAKIDNGTCSYTDTIHVSYNAYPKVELGEDTLLCAGQILTLDANFTGATYFWNDSTSNGIKEITTPGKYWVKVSLGPCSYSDTINVFYKNPAQVKLGNDTTFCGLESWRLDAGNPGADYLWSTGENTKAITVREAGTYWVIADFCGQKATDTVSVGFINYLPENLYMPTAFSPNNDFINDTLRAVGINEIEAFEWRIYNRWGQLVYQTNDINKPWDGKLNGVASPEGLYHWKLALRSPCLRNRDMSRSGVVYLVR